MAMFEQAMSMWASFGAAAGGEKAAGKATGTPGEKTETAQTSSTASERDELSDLKEQLATMQQKIEKLSQSRS
jgi:polyhydroxyalkanoate synthesis regulator protein